MLRCSSCGCYGSLPARSTDRLEMILFLARRASLALSWAEPQPVTVRTITMTVTPTVSALGEVNSVLALMS